MAAGLAQVAEYLGKLRFTEEDNAWIRAHARTELASLPPLPRCRALRKG